MVLKQIRVIAKHIYLCSISLLLGLTPLQGVFLGKAAAAPVAFTRTVIDTSLAGYIDNKATGDINGDGLTDVIIGTGEQNVGQLVWYSAPGWAKTVIASGRNFTTDMQAGDVDNDGDIDIITPEYDQNQVVYYRNPRIGGGTWTRIVIGTGTAHDVETGDINADGKLDVIIRGHGGATTLFLQSAPESWTAATITTAIASEGTALGDIDKDGKLDIVQNGYWLKAPANPADGSAWTKHDIDTSWASDYVAVTTADMNLDGRLDVLLARSESAGRMSWYEAPADPINGTWLEHTVNGSVDYVHTFKTGDIDKDGDLDIAFAEMQQSAQKRVGYFENTGSGLSWTAQVIATTGSHNIRLLDVGNDKDLDILGANWQGGPVELWENQLNPTLSLDSWAYKQVSGAHTQTFGLAFGDINQDTQRDIVSGRHWYASPGGDMQSTWSQSSFPSDIHAMLVVDVDGDSLADVIGQNNSGANIYWLEATTTAATAWNVVQIGTLPASSHTLGMQGYRAAQLEAGGKPELVFSSWNGGGIQYFRIPATNPEGGNWPKIQVNASPSDEGFGIGDIDVDGDIDIAASPGNPQNIQWYRNPGNGTANWSAFTIGTAPEFDYVDRFEVADMNGDARPDIIASEENGAASGAQTYWWERPADPTSASWTRHTVVADQGSTNSMDAADMDNDGDTDIITGEHRGSLRVIIWENNGSGTAFTPHQVDQGKESHDAARVFDLDNDGDKDIVSIGYDAPQALHLWRNDATVNTTPPPADTTLPVVSITSPSDNSTVSGNVNIAASASDNVGVTKVEFKVDGTLKSTVTTSPYAFMWNSTDVPDGSHTISATAYDAANNSATTSITVTVNQTAVPPRVTQGLTALYDFKEGTGTVVGDKSGNGTPLNLNILDATKIKWLSGSNGIEITAAGSAVKSAGAATKINDAAKTSGKVTLEAWATPSSLSQDGPARIVTLSNGTTASDVNIHLGQSQTSGSFRLRTSSNTFNNLLVPNTFSNTTNPWHVVVTYDGSTQRMYVNGVLQTTTASPGGNLSNWNSAYPLTLGNEATLDRSWLGKIYLTAFYNRELTNSEVQQNYSAGPYGTPPDSQAPTTPTNLTAQVVSATQVNLAWTASTDNVGVVKYQVLRDSQVIGQPSGTTYNDTTATPNTTHTYVVRAVDAAGNISPNSNAVSVTTPDAPDTQAPSAPATLTATAVSQTQVNLSWTASTDNVGVVKYQVFRNGSTTPLAEPTSTTFSDTTVSPNTTYSYTVKAVDAAGNVSSASDTATVTTPAPPDTEAPTATITTPANGSTVSGTVTVSASASDNVGVAGVQFKLDGVNLGIEDTTAPYSISWNTRETTEGAHTLTATVRDTAGNNASSQPVSVTVQQPLLPPRITQNLIALYAFSERSGDTINDTSNNGTPLNLQILDTNKIKWLNNANGVEFTATGSAIKSPSNASKITDAVKTSGTITLEAWVTPSNLSQDGPARILTISNGTAANKSNIHMGQDKTSGTFRLRTTTNLFNRLEPTNIFSDTTKPLHIVNTFDGITMRMYINGVLQSTTKSPGGNLSNWDSTYPLMLGNESTLNRSWLGKIHLTAFYSHALTAEEVQQNYTAGLPAN